MFSHSQSQVNSTKLWQWKILLSPNHDPGKLTMKGIGWCLTQANGIKLWQWKLLVDVPLWQITLRQWKLLVDTPLSKQNSGKVTGWCPTQANKTEAMKVTGWCPTQANRNQLWQWKLLADAPHTGKQHNFENLSHCIQCFNLEKNKITWKHFKTYQLNLMEKKITGDKRTVTFPLRLVQY